jgi:hypothetical protein
VSASHFQAGAAGQSTNGRTARPSTSPTQRIATIAMTRSLADFTIAFHAGCASADRITRP